MLWYALQVRCNCEPLVEYSLLRGHRECFFPFEDVKRTRGEIYRRPFFPGYVFVRMDLTDQHPVTRIPQVLRVVSAGLDPLSIPDREIEGVRRVAALAKQLKVVPVKAFHEGQRVLVKAGPLRGIEGYVAYEKSETRLVVAVEFLGQGVSAEVDATWLQPVLKAAA